MAESAATQEFDILILGGGSAGYSAALRAVQLGFTVGLIEKAKLGGTCLHWGCIPTKAYLHSAELAENAREGAKYGINTTLESIDLGAVRSYKDNIVAGKYKGLTGLLKMKKVTVIEGNGRLVSQDTIDVDGVAYKGKNIILATGSESKTFGLEIGGRILTSTEALTMDTLPKSAIVLGGGVIGVEFASVWKSFGVDVTIVEGLPSLVPNEDPSIFKYLERAFKKRGALSVVDCWGNDVPEGKLTSFSLAVQRKPDETVVFSWVTWPSKQVRDEAWKLLMDDPDMPKDMPFDGQRLIYGGFELLSDV